MRLNKNLITVGNNYNRFVLIILNVLVRPMGCFVSFYLSRNSLFPFIPDIQSMSQWPKLFLSSCSEKFVQVFG